MPAFLVAILFYFSYFSLVLYIQHGAGRDKTEARPSRRIIAPRVEYQNKYGGIAMKKPGGAKGKVDNRFCGLPAVPERKLDENIDPNRAFLIRYIEKKWVNQTILKYHFLDEPVEWRGDNKQKQAVRAAFKAWKDLGLGLDFTESGDPANSEIRIAFETGGSWSYVGRDAIDIVKDPRKKTMNFGWDLTTPYGRDTALHEIGHALGFPHEHQNPNAGIVWNEQAVYTFFKGSPNFWGEGKTRYNVIRKISSAEVQGTEWDKDSIMHYNFPAGLIDVPEEFRSNPLEPAPGLSQTDIKEVRKFYPEVAVEEFPELQPFLSRLVEIEPGEQLDFTIKPPVNRDYTIQTFGNIDTVIVLFEDTDGEPVYLAGDDDSGTDLNAQIKLRLIPGRTYYLRLRLYYASASGDGAVMLW